MIDCPFCGEDGFDIEGLKGHIEGRGVFTDTPWCPAYEAAEEISAHIFQLEQEGVDVEAPRKKP